MNRILNLVRVVGDNSEGRAGMSYRLIIILRSLETTWHGPSTVNARYITKGGIGIADIMARSLEDTLRAHHRPGESQETVLKTLEGWIHDPRPTRGPPED